MGGQREKILAQIPKKLIESFEKNLDLEQGGDLGGKKKVGQRFRG